MPDYRPPKTRYQGAILQGDLILLIRHQEHASGRDYWLVPGGGIEPGESETACVIREMKEETHLDVAVGRLLLEEHWTSDEGYTCAQTYLCQVIGGQPQPGYEPEPEAAQKYAIAEVGWFDLRDPTSWGEKVNQDAITRSLLDQLRVVLGY